MNGSTSPVPLEVPTGHSVAAKVERRRKLFESAQYDTEAIRQLVDLLNELKRRQTTKKYAEQLEEAVQMLISSTKHQFELSDALLDEVS